MIDSKRRILLAVLSTTGAATILPACATPAQTLTGGISVPLTETGVELSFSNRPGIAQVVTISNTTTHPVVLKHVYPGIVRSHNQIFDLNDLLSRQALTIKPGRSQSLSIRATLTNAGEQPMPAGVTHSKPLVVTTRYHTPGGDASVKTIRSYLA